MATCTGNNYVQTIDRSECIGNSLVKINANFKALDNETCRVSNIIASTGSLAVADSTTIDLTYNSATNTLSADITGKVPNANGGAGTLSGVLKATAGVVSVAIPGGDYMTPGAAAGGDLSGTYPSPSVVKIQGVSVSSSTPSDGQVLTYNSSTSTWTAATPAPAVPSGCIMMWGNSTLPSGWLECNGQSTGSYPALAALYGATVPDLRGEFVRGWDHGKGTDSGRTLGSAQGQDIQPHSHLYGGADNYSVGNAGTALLIRKGTSYSTSSTGGTETRPRNVALMYIIKT